MRKVLFSETSSCIPFSFAAFRAASSAFFLSLKALSSSSSSFFSFLAAYSPQSPDDRWMRSRERGTGEVVVNESGVEQTFKGFSFPPCRDIRTLLFLLLWRVLST